MARVGLSESATDELASFSKTDQQSVSAAISLLKQDKYRNQNKVDFNLVEGGYKIWALFVDVVNLAFHELPNGDICVDWLSLRSKFR
ncbi:MAG TPA: hypothetical protein G4O12_04195 [Dehalococcoidia bacterium]|nr:hypothetical protein [Dehalococcoidia bacterium]